MIREDENFKKKVYSMSMRQRLFHVCDESARLRWRRLKKKVDALHDAIMH